MLYEVITHAHTHTHTHTQREREREREREKTRRVPQLVAQNCPKVWQLLVSSQ